jgi:hypothetical protein
MDIVREEYSRFFPEDAFATLILLAVALGTLSLQIGKAIKTRPVEILKDE